MADPTTPPTPPTIETTKNVSDLMDSISKTNREIANNLKKNSEDSKKMSSVLNKLIEEMSKANKREVERKIVERLSPEERQAYLDDKQFKTDADLVEYERKRQGQIDVEIKVSEKQHEHTQKAATQEELLEAKRRFEKTKEEAASVKQTRKVIEEVNESERTYLELLKESGQMSTKSEFERLEFLRQERRELDHIRNVTSEMDEALEDLGVNVSGWGGINTPEEEEKLAELKRTKNALELNLRSFNNISEKFTRITGIVDSYQESKAVADKNSLAQLKILSLGVSALTKNPLSLALAGGIKSIFSLTKWLSGEKQLSEQEKLQNKIEARAQKRQDEYDVIQKKMLAGMGSQTDAIEKLTKSIEKDIGLRTIKSKVSTSDVRDIFSSPTRNTEGPKVEVTSKGKFWDKFGPMFSLIGKLIYGAISGLMGIAGIIAGGLLASFVMAHQELSLAAASLIGLGVGWKKLAAWGGEEGILKKSFKGLFSKLTETFKIKFGGTFIEELNSSTKNFKESLNPVKENYKEFKTSLGKDFKNTIDDFNKVKKVFSDFSKGILNKLIDPELAQIIEDLKNKKIRNLNMKASTNLVNETLMAEREAKNALLMAEKEAYRMNNMRNLLTRTAPIREFFKPVSDFLKVVAGVGKSTGILFYDMGKVLLKNLGQGIANFKFPDLSFIKNNAFVQKLIQPFAKILGFLKFIGRIFQPLLLAFSIFDGIRDAMKVYEQGGTIWESITAAGQTMFEDINKYLIGGLLDFFKDIVGWLIVKVGKMLDVDMSGFQTFLDSFTFTKLFDDFYKASVPVLTNMIEWVMNIPSNISVWFSGIINAIDNFFSRPIGEIFGDIGESLENLVVGFKDVFIETLDKLKTFVMDIFKTVGEIWNDPKGYINNLIKNFFSPKSPEQIKEEKEKEISNKSVLLNNTKSSEGLERVWDAMTDEQKANPELIKIKDTKTKELVKQEKEKSILKEIKKAKSSSAVEKIVTNTENKEILNSPIVKEAISKKKEEIKITEETKRAITPSNITPTEMKELSKNAGLPSASTSTGLGGVGEMFITATNVYLSTNEQMSKAVQAQARNKAAMEAAAQNKGSGGDNVAIGGKGGNAVANVYNETGTMPQDASDSRHWQTTK